jgi:hypothetical protein
MCEPSLYVTGGIFWYSIVFSRDEHSLFPNLIALPHTLVRYRVVIGVFCFVFLAWALLTRRKLLMGFTRAIAEYYYGQLGP